MRMPAAPESGILWVLRVSSGIKSGQEVCDAVSFVQGRATHLCSAHFWPLVLLEVKSLGRVWQRKWP